ncbi:STAS/SEC14 domain-containing protein [Flavobacterium sp.]|uniref:STAS/SEC14 domain-containing protein n=1 Tax=Flavobacterium sp. TaxID=239 RepID=UPI001203F72E|nr:STAS/SEC14 domain-containing protein [Flavobacterium sp.]RZJ73503.1 MAG: STAS/SEC14 domain-containing protein [Flavobacterium sp.]
MIQQINNVPDNMVAFRSSGEVTKDDFDTVFPKVEELVERTGKLNYLLELDNSPADFTAGAWLQDALLGVKNITKWNRAAIVTDSEQIRTFTDAFSKLMPGEFRGFSKDEFDNAVDWVSEKTI